MLFGAKEIRTYLIKCILKRRNCLEQQKLNAFVFVKCNLQLEIRENVRDEKKDNYNYICLSNIKSNNEWIIEK